MKKPLKPKRAKLFFILALLFVLLAFLCNIYSGLSFGWTDNHTAFLVTQLVFLLFLAFVVSRVKIF